MPANNAAMKAAFAPAVNVLGALVIGFSACWILLHYAKRTNADIAAANAQPDTAVFANMSPIRSAEASTQPYAPPAMPETPGIPATVDPVAIEMAVMQDKLREIEQSMLQARIESDAMIARSRDIREQTPPTVMYIQAQPALYTAQTYTPAQYSPAPGEIYNNTMRTMGMYRQHLQSADLVHMYGNTCIAVDGNPVQCVCTSDTDCRRLR